MKVLVTGASGFVGGWMTRHLDAAGDEVLTLPDDLDVRDGTALTDAVVAAGAGAVCHLAGQASVADSWHDAGATFEVNALGVAHLLDAVSRCEPVPRVLLVSSAEVYGTVGPEDLPVTEDHPFAPVNPYAASKAAAELVGLQAWLGRGIEVVRARPFNHTGPGQRADFVVPGLARQVVEALREGSPALRVGNTAAKRDIADVRDVVAAYRLLLERGESGRAYNVCTGESHAIADIVDRLLRLAGAELEVEVDPARLRPADVPDLRGDPSRLRADTGWEPAVPLDQTLSDVLAWERSDATFGPDAGPAGISRARRPPAGGPRVRPSPT